MEMDFFSSHHSPLTTYHFFQYEMKNGIWNDYSVDGIR